MRAFSFFSTKIGGIKSKDYIDDCERIWRCAMQQKVSLVCFHEGSDEIVGLSLLIVNTKNDLFLKEFAEQVCISL